MYIFIEPLLIRDVADIECTVGFKGKGDNYVNDTKIQQKLFNFNVIDKQEGINISSYRSIKQLNNKTRNMKPLFDGRITY